MHHPQPNNAFGGFKIVATLGKGSYGTVHRVVRLATGQDYAMKETDIGRMSQQERQDAVNEIRLLGSLKHPNVVVLHETFVVGNKLNIVMELCPGGDLSAFIKAAAASRMPFPEQIVWQIFLQLCQGMNAIHSMCVIHRDIKPANIFMCPGSVAKIGDLGVAKALKRDRNFAQTQIGTPVFMAPEVWSGRPYGYSSDLYSLGCVLYQMLTFRIPFDGKSLADLKAKVLLGRVLPVPAGTYSAPLIDICHALLHKDPRARPTCAAILASLEAMQWMHVVPEAVRGAVASGEMLATIKVPRDLRLLQQALPKPRYTLRSSVASVASDMAAALTAASGGGAAALAAGRARLVSNLAPVAEQPQLPPRSPAVAGLAPQPRLPAGAVGAPGVPPRRLSAGAGAPPGSPYRPPAANQRSAVAASVAAPGRTPGLRLPPSVRPPAPAAASGTPAKPSAPAAAAPPLGAARPRAESKVISRPRVPAAAAGAVAPLPNSAAAAAKPPFPLTPAAVPSVPVKGPSRGSPYAPPAAAPVVRPSSRPTAAAGAIPAAGGGLAARRASSKVDPSSLPAAGARGPSQVRPRV